MSEFDTSLEAAVENIEAPIVKSEEHDEYYHFMHDGSMVIDDEEKAKAEDEVKFNRLLSNLGRDFIVKGEVHLNNVERFLMVCLECWIHLRLLLYRLQEKLLKKVLNQMKI